MLPRRGTMTRSIALLSFALVSLVLPSAAAAQCVPPPPGMVSWFPGEDSAADIVGPNSGSLEGGAGFVDGKVGRAFHFDGIDAALHSPSLGMPTGSADRTIEGWVKVDAISPGAFEAALFGYGAFGSFTQT